MYDIYELYILNSVIDGKNVFSLPLFSEMDISKLVADTIKERMIEKGFLESPSSLADSSVRTIQRLQDFKHAKSYFQIDTVTMGIINDQEAILIIENPFYKNYEIKRVDISKGLQQLQEAYTFLKDESISEKIEETETRCSERKLERLGYDKKLSLKIHSKSVDDEAKTLFFKKEDGFYVYDYLDHILYKKNYDTFIQILNERVKIHD
ncbi:DUF5081 family protein [Enterococcus sp. BWM-S5]|uniref:DUF5081 family protein n=1 Tax=Enterococcus larvae TaxID=2794352 RepID=A0ABS4CLQ5_9ENTE|nr:DUF5081 family protein [Enterococcus larvae]MBP1046897.1 DUF5081 family protein [Enterococcus larvae]